MPSARREPGQPERQISPDAEGARLFAIGCLAILVAFLLLTFAVWWFWTR
jgi:hypothetical protein